MMMDALVEFCRWHSVRLDEARLGAVWMLRPGRPAGKPPVWHTILEARSFRPEALDAVFDIGPEQYGDFMLRVADIEKAHRMWLKAKPRSKA
jgi:hypothetical protein